MIEVKLNIKEVNDLLEIVADLKNKGYVQGTHYDFEYHHPKELDWSGDVKYHRYVIFRFYKDELATWFRLIYE